MWFKINTARQAPDDPWVNHNVYTTLLTAGAGDPVDELKNVLGDIIEMEGGTLPKAISIEIGEGEPPTIEDWFDEAMKNDYPEG